MPFRLQLPTQFGGPSSWTEAVTLAADDPELTTAVMYFRGVLGENWRGWQERFHLARSFHTRFQAGPREWVRLYRLAHALHATPHCELVVKDLGSATWTKHVAAEQALEFCGRLRPTGHRVDFIQSTHERSPDTRVWLHDRPVTVEFKALHDPDEREPWTAFEEALISGLTLRRHGTGQNQGQLEFAAEFELPALSQVDVLIDFISKIIEARGPSWYALPRGAGWARFAAEQDPERGWRIPVTQKDDLSRVLSNLHSKWIKQLQTVDGPTLLVVLTDGMFFMPEDILAEVQRVTDELRGVLSNRRMLGGVLLHEEPFLPTYAPLHAAGEDWRFDMGGTEGRARSVLLMQNPTAHAPLVTAELDPLIGAAMCW